jgi:ABC-2 type transport system permease protein
VTGAIRRIAAIVRKETWHIGRDWQTLAIVIAMPVVMMFLYGYALTLDVKEVPVVIEDPAPSQLSRDIARRVDASGLFSLKGTVSASPDPVDLLRRHRAKVLLRLPADLARQVKSGGSPARIQALIDGSDQNTATIIRNVVEPVLRDIVLDHAGIEPPTVLTVHPRMLYNPQQESALFFVPGLMAIILMMVSAMLTSLTITREKEQHTMEQLLVSPLHPWEIITGKIIPYVVLAAADGALILTVGRIFFGVVVRGSYLVLAGAVVLYVLTALSVGLIFSTIAKNQQQAMLMVLPATMMPSIILSGFIFPIDSMPVVLRVIAHLLPPTYFLQVIRAIILKGVGLEYVWRPLAAMAGIGAVFMVLSIKKFRIRL